MVVLEDNRQQDPALSHAVPEAVQLHNHFRNLSKAPWNCTIILDSSNNTSNIMNTPHSECKYYEVNKLIDRAHIQAFTWADAGPTYFPRYFRGGYCLDRNCSLPDYPEFRCHPDLR